MKLQYGEAFRRFGIDGMGRMGAPWCAIDPDGALVLMAHQRYFDPKRRVYEMPPYEPDAPIGPSARRSLDMIADYFAKSDRIILPVGIFTVDGERRKPDGSYEASEFDYATGDYYVGRIVEFDPATAYLLCTLESRHTVAR